MEPKILMIGRTQEVIDTLISELKVFNRDVIGSNKKDIIRSILVKDKFDFAVIGAGLPDEDRNDMKDYLQSIDPKLNMHMVERTEKGSPFKLIEYINQKAVEWKVEQKLGK